MRVAKMAYSESFVLGGGTPERLQNKESPISEEGAVEHEHFNTQCGHAEQSRAVF